MHGKLSIKSKIAEAVAAGISVVLVLMVFAKTASAQEETRWTGNIGVGFSPLVGALDKRLDNGWHTSFGAGYRFTSRFSVGAQVMYNGFGVSKGVLQEVAVPDGNAHLWAFTEIGRAHV